MANIKVGVNYMVADGSEIVFHAPCDCSEVTGLKVDCIDIKGNQVSKEFAFKDAHGNNLGDVDNLFTAGVYVKVILNVTEGIAYIQNADTNKYLEGKFEQTSADARRYTDSQISNMASTGIPKLMVFPLPTEATVEDQTVFQIDLDTFSIDTDTVLVQSGRTMLFPEKDFSVVNNTVVLKEGVEKGRTIGIYVMKNVPVGEDGSVAGIVISPGSLPLDRLAEAVATPSYVDQQIAKSAEVGVPKLMVYPLSQISTSDGQTVFNIALNTFDATTDTVLVQSGRTMLFPNEDFTVSGKTVVLNEGVPKDVTIGIYVFKNVPLGEDGSVSGVVISQNSLPLDRLAQMPTASDVGAIRNKSKRDGSYGFEIEIGDHTFITTNYDSSVPTTPSVTNYTHYICTFNGAVDSVLSIPRNNGTRAFYYTKGDAKWHEIGDLSGATLRLLGGFSEIVTEETNVLLKSKNAKDSDANFRGLYIANSKAQTDIGQATKLFDRVNNTYAYYDLFGEHNKPEGSYYGDNKTDTRIISIGGIGNIIAITYDAHFSLVHSKGAVCFYTDGRTDIQTYSANAISFENGVLTIKTNIGFFNGGGCQYKWQLL